MYTLSQSINFAAPFIQYSPVTAGVGKEPAISAATMVRNSILGAPMTWPWNRNEVTGIVVTKDVQDYLITNAPDFGFLEKATLTDANGTIHEIQHIFNSEPLGFSSDPDSRPNAIAVTSSIPYSSFNVRLMGTPDATYTLNLTYQKIAYPFASDKVISVTKTTGSIRQQASKIVNTTGTTFTISFPQTCLTGSTIAIAMFAHTALGLSDGVAIVGGVDNNSVAADNWGGTGVFQIDHSFFLMWNSTLATPQTFTVQLQNGSAGTVDPTTYAIYAVEILNAKQSGGGPFDDYINVPTGGSVPTGTTQGTGSGTLTTSSANDIVLGFSCAFDSTSSIPFSPASGMTALGETDGSGVFNQIAAVAEIVKVNTTSSYNYTTTAGSISWGSIGFAIAMNGTPALSGATVYTGVFDGQTFPVGSSVTISGFTNPTNNGTFTVVSCTSTSLTVINTAAINETVTTGLAENSFWFPIPDSYMDVYNNLFLSEMLSVADDMPASQTYRQRGVAAFLSRASGLTDTQKNAFLRQWQIDTNYPAISALKAQQGVKAREV